MTVLLADGEWQSRLMEYCYLTAHGLRVLPAEDGTEAMHVAREHTDKIDVLIVDVSCGLELAQTIGAEGPDLPTIFISSGEARAPALHKPFAFDQLMTAISNLLYSTQRKS